MPLSSPMLVYSNSLAFVQAVLVFILCYWALLQYLRRIAWRSAVERMRLDKYEEWKPVGATVAPGWTFFSRAPSYWGSESWLQLLVHMPCYILRIIAVAVYYFPRDLMRRYVWRQDISDQDVWDLVTNTLLIMLCETDDTGEYLTFRGESCSKILFVNGKNRRETVIDGSSLVLHMRQGKIVSAVVDSGPVTAPKWMSRNEVLYDVLVRTLGIWVHTQTHVAAERCAASIARNEVTALAPGALFTHSLHDGLLHGPLSPAADVPVFRSSIPQKTDWVANLKNQIPHKLERIRAPGAFRVFNFYRGAHPKVMRLLGKHQLHKVVDVNDFFAASVMHSIDHAMLYRVWNKLPLRASYNDSRVSWWLSVVENCFFNQVWNRPVHNVLFSELAKDSPLPVFQELYQALARLDPELAGIATLSTSY